MNQLKHFKGVIVPLHGKDINAKGNKVHRPTLAQETHDENVSFNCTTMLMNLKI